MGSVEGRVAIQYVLIPSLQPSLMVYAFQDMSTRRIRSTNSLTSYSFGLGIDQQTWLGITFRSSATAATKQPLRKISPSFSL